MASRGPEKVEVRKLRPVAPTRTVPGEGAVTPGAAPVLDHGDRSAVRAADAVSTRMGGPTKRRRSGERR